MRTEIDQNILDLILVSTTEERYLYSFEYRELFNLLYLTGCRINDILEFQRWNVLNNGDLLLQPQKNNNLRLFKQNEVTLLFYNSILENNNMFNGMLYGSCEYHLLKVINKYDIRKDKKKITTHLYRHNYTKKLKMKGFTDEQIKVILGEKQLASAQNYIYSSFTAYI